MLTNISWGTYLTGLAALLAVYYAYVGIRYYSREIKGIFSGRKREHSTSPVIKEVEDEENPETALHEKAEEFSSQIKASVADAHRMGYDNQQTLGLLEPIFTSFSILKYSPYRAALTELVLSECGKHGSVILSEEDLDDLWNEVA